MTADHSALVTGIAEDASVFSSFAAPTKLLFGELPALKRTQGLPGHSPSATLAAQLVIGTDWDQCRLVLDLVSRGAESRGFDEKTVNAIRVALQEALANAVKHGNRYEDGLICVDYQFRGDLFRVRITDQGSGFDPRLVPDPTLPENTHKPSGRGLLMMRYYMTGVRFSERGNSVEMWKGCRAESSTWTVHRE